MHSDVELTFRRVDCLACEVDGAAASPVEKDGDILDFEVYGHPAACLPSCPHR